MSAMLAQSRPEAFIDEMGATVRGYTEGEWGDVEQALVGDRMMPAVRSLSNVPLTVEYCRALLEQDCVEEVWMARAANVGRIVSHDPIETEGLPGRVISFQVETEMFVFEASFEGKFWYATHPGWLDESLAEAAGAPDIMLFDSAEKYRDHSEGLEPVSEVWE